MIFVKMTSAGESATVSWANAAHFLAIRGLNEEEAAGTDPGFEDDGPQPHAKSIVFIVDNACVGERNYIFVRESPAELLERIAIASRQR